MRRMSAVVLGILCVASAVCAAEIGLLWGGWKGQVSEAEAEWNALVIVKNNTFKPMGRPRIRFRFAYLNSPKTYVRELSMPDFQSVGGFTLNMLLPYYRSKPTMVSVRLPLEGYRRDVSCTVEIASAPPFDARGDLHDPLKLLCFIYESASSDVLRAFKKDPTLLKVRTKSGRTPILMAVLQHELEVVKGLEKLGGSIKDRTASGQNALHHAAMSTPEMVAYVARRGVKFSVTGESGKSPLDYAVEHGNSAVFSALVKAGVPLESRDRDGKTAFLTAIGLQRFDHAAQLRQLGASPSVFDGQGMGPVGMIVAMGWLDKLPLGEAVGGKATERDPGTGLTPLHFAVRFGRGNAAAWLVSRGADLNARDNQGRTPRDLIAIYRKESAQYWHDYFSRAAKNRNEPWFRG